MQIPLVDLERNYENYRPEYERILLEAAGSCAYILGKYVNEFEEAFASYLGVKHVVGVGSGTDALTLILRSLELPPGSPILTQSNTFIATTLAIHNAGHEIKICDVDPITASMAIDSYEGPTPKVVMPVHLHGLPYDVGAIRERWPNAIIVEDACQAHGSHLNGKRCGNLGTAAAFSFYPGKNLGAFGDGGAVATNDDGIAEEIRALRNWGGSKKYIHDHDGGNSRLDGIQAAILSFKLTKLDMWNVRRNELAERYRSRLEGLEGIQLPATAPANSLSNYHLFVIESLRRDRDSVLQQLHDATIFAGIHYPVPIHRQKVYASSPLAELNLPIAEQAAERILSLPMFPDMLDEECDYVCDRLTAILGK